LILQWWRAIPTSFMRGLASAASGNDQQRDDLGAGVRQRERIHDRRHCHCAVDPSIVGLARASRITGRARRGRWAYKSLDGGRPGRRWGCRRLAHRPDRDSSENPEVVYVAALGICGAEPERGVYKTSDGAELVASSEINEDTGVSDIAIDPESPDTLYAAAYERRRTPLGLMEADRTQPSTRRPMAARLEEIDQRTAVRKWR